MFPFAIFGHPSLPKTLYTFTPTSRDGAKEPKLKDQTCYGWNLSGTDKTILQKVDGKIQLSYLLEAYKLFPEKEKFFITPKSGKPTDYFFNKLAGNDALQKQMIAGTSEKEIRDSWAEGLNAFKKIRKKYLQRAEKGVERLIYIVKDLDMITKLEMDTLGLELTKFNIIDVIQNVLDLLEMRASKKNILLTFDMKYVRPIYVLADLEKIQQVITNLVENSIKYGKEGGTTEVGVEDFVNNKVIIKISDNGEGIEKQHIPRLFERFYRVDKSGARTEGGSGLGLAIVKHIIEGHKERINVESNFGKGSEFSFTLEKAK